MGDRQPPRRLQERRRPLSGAAPLVVRVLPEARGIEKTFDYLVPEQLRDQVRVGDRVRIDLHGRRVGAWIVAVDVEPPAGVTLKPLARWSSSGPPADVVALAEWGAWRWAGTPQHLLTTASPPTVVAPLPRLAPAPPTGAPSAGRTHDVRVHRIAPAGPLLDTVVAQHVGGQTLVVAPSIALARRLAVAFERAGRRVARYPRQWSLAAAGRCDVVVGARAAAWAPVPRLATVVVVDEHDEGHQEERTPSWHGREVAIERARRAGVPCVLTSPCPSLEALAAGTLVAPSRDDERAGWPVVDIVDRGEEDPRTRSSLVSDALARVLRSERRIVCVLNTKGVARLLACAACRDVARCERCDAAVAQLDDRLVCARCGTARPVVCTSCGASRMKMLRPGVSRLRAELEAATGGDVAELTAATAEQAPPDARVVVGTEAALHQVRDADLVAFLDIDAELLAPRYRAHEEAMALLARAARLVGGRAGGGRVLAQTQLPHHAVLQAALLGDPARLVAPERARRAELGFPPAVALAAVSGAGAEAFVASLPRPLGLEVLGPADGRWLVRAPDHDVLCDALDAGVRPTERLRVEVDPLRV